ncbi:MAG: hypothetical protein VXW57_05075, partial [Pseudomonadota bacterium]|nr:hypothetical protein [Pseudomonadota bacterium]
MKVRIPVVVGSNGRWAAAGGTYCDKQGQDWALIEESVIDPIGATEEDLSANLLRVWVEVELPMPEAVTVRGKPLPAP